jgi:hypothetical protein
VIDMRALMLAAALVALPAAAQTPTVVGEINALKAEVATLKTRVNVLENSYNIALYYALGHLCYANSMQATWVGALTGLKPFPLAGLTCPPEGERIYIPGFIGGQAAVLKPPPQ